MATGVLKDEISKELDDFISKVEEGGTVDQSVLKFIKRVKDNIVKFGFDASGNLMQSITSFAISCHTMFYKYNFYMYIQCKFLYVDMNIHVCLQI